jgi:hypothetical protein
MRARKRRTLEAMRFGKQTAGMIAALLVAALAARAESKPEASVKAAEAAATPWLALVDAGDSAASWSQAAPVFRQQVTEDQWRAAVGSARGPFGKLLSRKLSSARYTTSLPGAPDGEYVVIRYATSFEKKRDAIETVTPMKGTDGVWRVSGYFIR